MVMVEAVIVEALQGQLAHGQRGAEGVQLGWKLGIAGWLGSHSHHALQVRPSPILTNLRSICKHPRQQVQRSEYIVQA